MARSRFSPAVRRPALAQKAKYRLRYGTAFPADHPGVTRIQEAAKAIAAETGDAVDLQVYPNSQLGSEPDMFSQTRSGALDFMSTSGVNQTLVPVGGINAVAFAFDDYDKVWAAMDGELGNHVRAAVREGRPARVRKAPRQRLPEHHLGREADQEPGRSEGLQDPRAGQPALGHDVQGARRRADADPIRRTLRRSADARSSMARRTRSP